MINFFSNLVSRVRACRGRGRRVFYSQVTWHPKSVHAQRWPMDKHTSSARGLHHHDHQQQQHPTTAGRFDVPVGLSSQSVPYPCGGAGWWSQVSARTLYRATLGQQVHPSEAPDLHHGCSVKETVFSRGLWTRSRGPWWPGQGGALLRWLRQEAAGKRGGGQVVAAVVGSGEKGRERRRGGAGGVSWCSFFGLDVPVTQWQVPTFLFDNAPQIQFIDRVVGFPVVLQKTVEILLVPFLLLVWHARCCASTGAWPYVPTITQRQVPAV